MTLAIFVSFLPAETPEELIGQGDVLYAQRQDPLLAAQALAKYQEALHLSPDNFTRPCGKTPRSCTSSATIQPAARKS